MPATRSHKRGKAISRNQRKRAGATQALPDQPYVPGPDRGFVPRNQRNATRDERGRLVNPDDWRTECR